MSNISNNTMSNSASSKRRTERLSLWDRIRNRFTEWRQSDESVAQDLRNETIPTQASREPSNQSNTAQRSLPVRNNHDFTELHQRMRQMARNIEEAEQLMRQRRRQPAEPQTSRAAYLERHRRQSEDSEHQQYPDREILGRLLAFHQEFGNVVADLGGPVDGLRTDVSGRATVRTIPTVTVQMRSLNSSDMDDHGTCCCGICQEDKTIGDLVAMLPPCAHWFCEDCIRPLLEQNNTCPMCRTVLTVD